MQFVMNYLRLNSKFLGIIETNAFALEEPTHKKQNNFILGSEGGNVNPLNLHTEKHQIGTAARIRH